MMLAHEPGVLSALFELHIRGRGQRIDHHTESAIHDRASVTISLDVSSISCELSGLIGLRTTRPALSRRSFSPLNEPGG